MLLCSNDGRTVFSGAPAMFEGRSLIDRRIAIRITGQTTRVGVATSPGHPADSIEVTVAVAALAEAVSAAAEHLTPADHWVGDTNR